MSVCPFFAVNIALKGQKEMCEREPESILCKDDE